MAPEITIPKKLTPRSDFDYFINLPEEVVIEYNQILKLIWGENPVAFISTPERVGMMKGFELGLHQGKAEILVRLLQRRFGQLSDEYLDQIRKTNTETLLIWGERALDAESLEKIFASL